MVEKTTEPSSTAAAWRERRKALRRQRESEDSNELPEEGDNALYVPYVSAAKRLRMERESALMLGEGAEDANDKSNVAKSRKILAGINDSGGAAPIADKAQQAEDASEEEEKEAPAETPAEEPEKPGEVQSLLDQAEALKTRMESTYTWEEREALAKKQEEQRILKEANQIQTNALQAKSEVAHGVIYNTALRTTWTVPKWMLREGEEEWRSMRKKWHILVEGADCPPAMKHFRDMKFPQPILDALAERNIKRPTPIQMQGLPVALAGRDMVGIAFTGSGKTMTFVLPLVMAALEEERRMPLHAGEGPVGVLLAPSRELARQTFDVLRHFTTALQNGEYPPIRSQLLIGGEDPAMQHAPFTAQGVHAVVATPGRLRDFLKRKRITFDICRYICLDEADRMLDLGFDEEVSEIMNYFKHQRQTLLFSATFPQKFRDFAQKTLVQPLVVNVGRAGAANLDVIQEVEYVKQEAKILYLLQCLQKTAPPVIIFCEKKGDVDDIHEYLLLKGVQAVSIHGGKDQEERNEAIRLYKDGQKDVLVATDVAAKGLDFADIQHVINFDMPSEIENYVHRIGRTGRCGKTGVATTFINKSCQETTLLDLKHLLKEAKQRIPPVLMMLDDPLERMKADEKEGRGCSFCGGLGHSIVDCPKIDKVAGRVAGGHKDAIAGGGTAGYGGDW